MIQKLKPKRCKVCNEVFTPNKPLVPVCGYKCAIEYNKLVKSKQKKEFEKVEVLHNEEKKLKASLLNTKMQVHAYVRERDKGKPCISCGVAWRDNFEAGHHYSANSFLTLKFNLDNIHGQCKFCNNFKEGNFDNYALNLPFRIGIKKYNDLQSLAAIDKQFSKVWNLENLKEIRNKIKLLKNSL